MALISIKAQLAKKIIARVESELADIKYVNIDMGQLDFYEQRPAVDFPCLLFKFIETQYDQQQLSQFGNVQVRFRLATNPVSDTSGLAPDAVLEKGLEYFELEDKLYKKFQYWAADGLLMNEMIRTRDELETREDPLRVEAITFKATFNDTGAG